LNAAASVLGSVGALVLALYVGLVGTLLVGGGLYLVALAVMAGSAVGRVVGTAVMVDEVSSALRE
jgi:hypothetical protein